MNRIYQLYISHSWNYHLEACKKKVYFLKRAGIQFNFQEAFDQAPHKSGNSKETYSFFLDSKIQASDCILVLAGHGEEQNYWTALEIELAKKYKKPIIAIEPWDPAKTMPILREKADIIVQWHGKMITDAIRSIA